MGMAKYLNGNNNFVKSFKNKKKNWLNISLILQKGFIYAILQIIKNVFLKFSGKRLTILGQET